MDHLHPYLFFIMEPTATKKRIEYIDLMKGFCIILVVGLHCSLYTNIDLLDNCLGNFRMPLYFFLSGLFFKKYSSFKEFLIKKTNKILIPYFFFCWVPYCALSFLFTSNFTNPVFWLLAPIKMFNGVLWFLRCLFMSHILYYGFVVLTEKRSKVFQICLLFLITFITLLVSIQYRKISYMIQEDIHIFILNIFISIMCLPYNYVAQNVMQNHWLEKEFSLKQTVFLLVIAISCAFIFVQENVILNKALFGDIYIFTYISALSSIFALNLICRKINKLPFVSYLGRYSLIVFGTHYAYLTILRFKFNLPNYIYFIIILALMPPTIWFFKKFFPYFTAQKDLLKYKAKN